MQLDFLDLVQVGFHGAAIAMAILSYRLLTQLLKMLQLNPTGDTLRWIKTHSGNVRMYMGLCLVLFIIGVLAQIFTAPVEAKIMISPASFPNEIKDYEHTLKVSHIGAPLSFVSGRKVILLSDNDDIQINVDDLLRRMQKLTEISKHYYRSRTPVGGHGE